MSDICTEWDILLLKNALVGARWWTKSITAKPQNSWHFGNTDKLVIGQICYKYLNWYMDPDDFWLGYAITADIIF